MSERIKKLNEQLAGTSLGRCPMSRQAAASGGCPFGVGSTTGLTGPPSPESVKPLGMSSVAAEFGNGDMFKDAILPPVVASTLRTATDPINWLIEQSKEHPEIFIVDRGGGNQYAVLSDVDMFEDVLTFDLEFGNPVTPNMSVNKNIFQIPEDQRARHEQNAISGLRKFLLNNNADLADVVAAKVQDYMHDRLGNSGEMDMRDFGKAIFWPMTEALFGDRANYRENDFLWPAFEDIDNHFGKALKGNKVPEVEEGVRASYSLFSDMVIKAKAGGQPMGPVMEYYDDVTKHEDPDLTAKLSTAAFWGGSGNSVPSTVWAFAMVLANPEAKRKAYAEVDGPFANEPNAEGHYDFDKLQYLTASLKETLRLKTYSIAWRQTQRDTVLTGKSGKKYLLKAGMLIGLHFAMRHFNPEVHPEPLAFRPERFLGTGAGLSPTINGHKYAWVPFSAGRHKCSGYSLAMLEIPVIMALALRKYDMEILDPLPGMDFRQAFGVVGPDTKPVRIRYSLRKK